LAFSSTLAAASAFRFAGIATWDWILAAGAGHRISVQNLFARQSRFHLIKLLETIALHAYATII